MKYVLYKWRLLKLFSCLPCPLCLQSLRIGLCRNQHWGDVFELIRASLYLSFSLPSLEPACQPQCSTCTSGLECSSCQPPLLMQHGQCVSTCGGGFYQDRHSCAGNHWLGHSQVGHSESHPHLRAICGHQELWAIFQIREETLNKTSGGMRTVDESDDTQRFYNGFSAFLMCICDVISVSPFAHTWEHWNSI